MYKRDINYGKSFSPIRMLLDLPEDKWKEFVGDNSMEVLGSVELLFAINEIFPFGVIRYERELGKFMADIDTIQVTLSFLSEFTSGRAEKAIFDLRISIQNFAMFLSARSYISAFQSFRKMLEGILWVREILSSTDLPTEITKMDYSGKLNEINPKFGALYSRLNKVFHHKNNNPQNFNLNILYGQEDSLNELLESITEVADDYTKYINNLVSESDDFMVKRYHSLLTKLEIARKSYNLMNFPISHTTGSRMPGKAQNIYAQLIIDDSNKEMLDNFVDGYSEGLDDLMRVEWENPFNMQGLGRVWSILKKFNDNFRFFGPMLNDFSVNKNHIYTKGQDMHIRDLKIEYHGDIIKKLKATILGVFKKEIADTDIDFHRLKSILEDVVACFAVNKNNNYSLLLYLISYLYECFGIRIDYNHDIARFKHILTDNRLKYIDGNGKTKGEITGDYYFELLDVILDAINAYIDEK